MFCDSGPHLGHLGPPFGNLASHLGHLRPHLGHLGPHLEHFGPHLGHLGLHLGSMIWEFRQCCYYNFVFCPLIVRNSLPGQLKENHIFWLYV